MLKKLPVEPSVDISTRQAYHVIQDYLHFARLPDMRFARSAPNRPMIDQRGKFYYVDFMHEPARQLAVVEKLDLNEQILKCASASFTFAS